MSFQWNVHSVQNILHLIALQNVYAWIERRCIHRNSLQLNGKCLNKVKMCVEWLNYVRKWNFLNTKSILFTNSEYREIYRINFQIKISEQHSVIVHLYGFIETYEMSKWMSITFYVNHLTQAQDFVFNRISPFLIRNHYESYHHHTYQANANRFSLCNSLEKNVWLNSFWQYVMQLKFNENHFHWKNWWGLWL